MKSIKILTNAKDRDILPSQTLWTLDLEVELMKHLWLGRPSYRRKDMLQVPILIEDKPSMAKIKLIKNGQRII